MAVFPRDCEAFCEDPLIYVTHLTQILRMCRVGGTELKEGRGEETEGEARGRAGGPSRAPDPAKTRAVA